MLKLIHENLSSTIAIVIYVAGLLFILVRFLRGAYSAAAATAVATSQAARVVTSRATRKGRVVPAGKLLRAPLSGRECVMYEFEILHIAREAVGAREIGDFILENSAERLFVYSNSVEMTHEFDIELNEPDPKYKELLAKFGIPYHDWEVYKVLSIRERYVVPGQEMQLTGSFDLIDAKPPIVQPVPGMKLTLTKA